MPEKTIPTEYGETTIEVVECSSCGAEVAKTDAEQFTLGNHSGWACEHCTETGPVSFPERAREFGLGPHPYGGSVVWDVMFFPGTAGLTVLFASFVPIDPNDTEDMWLQGYAVAIYGMLVWGLALLSLVVIL
jgi:hypothetical protein